MHTHTHTQCRFVWNAIWPARCLRVPDRSDGAGAMHHAKNRVLYQRNRVLGSRDGAVGRALVIISRFVFVCFLILARCNLRYLRKANAMGMVEFKD